VPQAPIEVIAQALKLTLQCNELTPGRNLFFRLFGEMRELFLEILAPRPLAVADVDDIRQALQIADKEAQLTCVQLGMKFGKFEHPHCGLAEVVGEGMRQAGVAGSERLLDIPAAGKSGLQRPGNGLRPPIRVADMRERHDRVIPLD
jgi:hypothetical protein